MNTLSTSLSFDVRPCRSLYNNKNNRKYYFAL